MKLILSLVSLFLVGFASVWLFTTAKEFVKVLVKKRKNKANEKKEVTDEKN